MKIIKKNWMLIILLISFFAIGSALIAEYFFEIFPCKMCLNQRYPYYFIIIISLIFFFIKKFSYIWKLLLIECALCYGIFYATWHIGIEQKILPGLPECTTSLDHTNSLIELKNQILNQTIITCDEITWTIVGLSAATINAFILLFLLIFNSIFLIQYFNVKKKS